MPIKRTSRPLVIKEVAQGNAPAARYDDIWSIKPSKYKYPTLKSPPPKTADDWTSMFGESDSNALEEEPAKMVFKTNPSLNNLEVYSTCNMTLVGLGSNQAVTFPSIRRNGVTIKFSGTIVLAPTFTGWRPLFVDEQMENGDVWVQPFAYCNNTPLTGDPVVAHGGLTGRTSTHCFVDINGDCTWADWLAYRKTGNHHHWVQLADAEVTRIGDVVCFSRTVDPDSLGSAHDDGSDQGYGSDQGFKVSGWAGKTVKWIITDLKKRDEEPHEIIVVLRKHISDSPDFAGILFQRKLPTNKFHSQPLPLP